MRNLHLRSDVSGGPVALALRSSGGVSSLCVTSPRASTGQQALYTLSPDGCLSAWSAQGGVVLWQCLLALPAPADAPAAPAPSPLGGRWLHVSYLSESGALFLVHSSGALLQRGLKEADVALESIGDIDEGVEAVAWTPDGRVLLLVVGDGKILTLSASSWDVLAETDFERKFVGGAGGGALAASSGDAAAPTTSAGGVSSQRSGPPPPLLPAPVGGVTATWRGDGAYFVLNVLDAATNARVLHIFSSDCTYRGMGRNEDGSAVPGLHAGAVAWSPDGTLIAVGQDVLLASRSRVQIAFFETNGLRHRELVIPGVLPAAAPSAAAAAPAAVLPSASVAWLSWNLESDLLAVLLEVREPPTPEGGGSSRPVSLFCLQLWHRDNYHWYLKRQSVLAGAAASHLPFDASTAPPRQGVRGAPPPPPVACTWCPERPYRLHYVSLACVEASPVDASLAMTPFSAAGGAVGSSSASCHTLDFDWRYDAWSQDASGTCAVGLDAARIAITPFSLACVPPPMAFATLALPSPTPVPKPAAAAAADGRSGSADSIRWDHSHLFRSLSASLCETTYAPPPSRLDAANSSLGESTQVRLLILCADNELHFAPIAYERPAASTAAPQAKQLAKISPDAAGSRVLSIGASGDTGRGHLEITSLHSGRPPRVERPWSVTLSSVVSGSLHAASLPSFTSEGAANARLFQSPGALRHLVCLASIEEEGEQLLASPFSSSPSIADLLPGAAADAVATNAQQPRVKTLVAFVASRVLASSHEQQVKPSAGVAEVASSSEGGPLFMAVELDHVVIALVDAPMEAGPERPPVGLATCTTSSLFWRPPPPAVGSPSTRIVALSTPTRMSLDSHGPQQQGAPAGAARTSTCWYCYAHCSDGGVWQLAVGLVRSSEASAQSHLRLLSASPLFRLPETLATLTSLHLVRSSGHSPRSGGNGFPAFSGSGGAAEAPSPLLVSFGARSCRLYINDSLLSSAVASAVVSTQHGLLLYCTVGPTPTLAAVHVGDLAAFAAARASPAVGSDSPAPLRLLQVASVAAAASGGVASARGAPPAPLRPRALERGSRLVTVLDAAGDGVLLQMPRGNCEVILPRVLALSSVRAALDVRPMPRWDVALELCRKHRLDMNLLVDHCPALLSADQAGLCAGVAQVERSVLRGTVGSAAVVRMTAALRGTDRWDLLLSALEKGDVTRAAGSFGAGSGAEGAIGVSNEGGVPASEEGGKYSPPSYYGGAPPANESAWAIESAVLEADPSLAAALRSDDKVNKACACIRLALLRAMLVPSASTRAQGGVEETRPPTTGGATTAATIIHWRSPLVYSILTSYARQVPPDFPAILRAVQAVAAEETAAAGASPAAGIGSSSAPISITGDAALAHAILIADSDVEILYTAALGMYDIPLAHALAQRGQGDPREYLPLLTRLASLGKARADDLDEFAAASSPSSSSATVEGAPIPFATLRLRWAVDVHLGRWKRAAKWLAMIAVRGGATSGALSQTDFPLQLPVGDASSAAASSASSDEAREGRAARLAALVSLKKAPASSPVTLPSSAASDSLLGSGTVMHSDSPSTTSLSAAAPSSSGPSTAVLSLANLKLALRTPVASVGSTFSTFIARDGNSASDTSQPEALVDVGLAMPLIVCMSLAAQHDAHAEVIDALASSGGSPSAAAAETSAAAPSPDVIRLSFPAAASRLLVIDGAWKLAAGLGNVGISPSMPQSMVESMSIAAASMVSSVSAPSIVSIFERLAPSSVLASPTALLTAPATRVAGAIEALLNRCVPPALDDALALALFCARFEYRLPAAAAGAVDGGAHEDGSLPAPAAPARSLWRHALSLACLPRSYLMRSATGAGAKRSFGGAGGDGGGPSLASVCAELAASLSHGRHGIAEMSLRSGGGANLRESLDVQALQAAAELYCGPAADVESGVRSLCLAGLWDEALRVATFRGRNDLAVTDVIPSMEDAVSSCIAECEQRSGQFAALCERLEGCRRLRVAMTLGDLIGAAEAARVSARASLLAAGVRSGDESDLMRSSGAGANARAAAGDDGDDDDASVSRWSDASSTFTDASDASERSKGSASSKLSGLSGASGGGASSAGRFSHVPASSLPTTLTNTRSSLRMSHEDMSGVQAIARDTQSAHRVMDRRAGFGERAYRTSKGQRKAETKMSRVRPGSMGEEMQLEGELLRIIPRADSGLRRFVASLREACSLLGFPAIAQRLVTSFNAMVEVIVARSAAPLPVRRNVCNEVTALLKHADVRVGPLSALELQQLEASSILPSMIVRASSAVDPATILTRAHVPSLPPL